MKIRNYLLFALLVLIMVSCSEREEMLNSEADITVISFSSDILSREPIIENDKITVWVKAGVDITALDPTFEITEGATIIPRSGTERDFTKPISYIVVSEDRKGIKEYIIEIKKPRTPPSSNPGTTDPGTTDPGTTDPGTTDPGTTDPGTTDPGTTDPIVPDPPQLFSWNFHFEKIKIYSGKKYETFIDDPLSDGVELEWASGNAGFAVMNLFGNAKSYPTSQADNGYSGKSLKLTTLSTGSFGAMAKSPIAAGNLFIGSFSLDMTSPAKSTHFGEPFYNVPIKIEGYYKYKAGNVYKDRNGTTQNKKDNFDIYAVLFETTTSVPYLDGTNILTHANVISVARMDSSEKQETDSWTHFEIPFEYRTGKSIDPEKLANGGYSITIVMSSSENGASFEGAEGSTLYVDELTLFME